MSCAAQPASRRWLALTRRRTTPGRPSRWCPASRQVLYGVDGVVPNTAPSGATDSVPDRYLRASQLVVAGDALATADNWRRVRSLRIGLIFRSPATDAIDRAAVAATYNVLGDDMSASADTLSQLTVPADGRMRQTMVFNVHLRNP